MLDKSGATFNRSTWRIEASDANWVAFEENFRSEDTKRPLGTIFARRQTSCRARTQTIPYNPSKRMTKSESRIPSVGGSRTDLSVRGQRKNPRTQTIIRTRARLARASITSLLRSGASQTSDPPQHRHKRPFVIVLIGPRVVLLKRRVLRR